MMLARINVPANAEVRLIAATIEKARGDGKEEWDSYRCVSPYIPYTSRNGCLQEDACGDDC